MLRNVIEMKYLIRKILREEIETTKYYSNIRNILDRLGLYGYGYKVLEYDKYHEWCPFGFDVSLDKVNKLVLLEICTQNEVIDLNMFWQTFEEELEELI